MSRLTRSWMMLVVVGSLVAACGPGDVSADKGGASVSVLGSNVKRSVDTTSDPRPAGASLLPFGSHLFAQLNASAKPADNVIVSPASVALALAMLEPGASGDARSRLDSALGIVDADRYRAGLNAMVQSLESRHAKAYNEGDKPGGFVLRVANAAYLQHGYPFKGAYVDTVARYFGPALHEVDFNADPDAVAHVINRFVEDNTKNRIKGMIGDGVLHRDDVLALVNALYLRASWMQPFDAAQTHDQTFTRRQGSKVQIPMMKGRSDASARGDGWIAATKSYVGDLAVQFVLPEPGRFDEVAAHLDTVAADFERNRTDGAFLAVPRFSTEFGVDLKDAFHALGIGLLFEPGNLLGVAGDSRLKLDLARHRTFLAMDEHGTEAAAATVLTGEATSGSLSPPVPVVLDRPFLFRIFDRTTGATLFIGSINDPTQ